MRGWMEVQVQIMTVNRDEVIMVHVPRPLSSGVQPTRVPVAAASSIELSVEFMRKPG